MECEMGGHSTMGYSEKIPIHPEGYVLWRGFMSEKAVLNGWAPNIIKEKKKENSILNKMSVSIIKDADTHILVKRGQTPSKSDESIHSE